MPEVGLEPTLPEGNRILVVLPDNDEPGRRHAEKVAKSLWSKAASIKVLKLPGLPDKGDVSDWLDAGGSGRGTGLLGT